MAFDIFLEIDGIPGESTDAKHQNQIEVLSYSHGLSQSVTSRSSGGAGSGERCDHGDFTITHTLDKASPKLVDALCKGTHISKVTVYLCRATGDKTEYMRYEMEDVLVSSVQTGGSGSGDIPVEQVSFNYGQIKWNYTETDHKTGANKGSIQAGWSVVENTAV